jgi:hypothetical protein
VNGPPQKHSISVPKKNSAQNNPSKVLSDNMQQEKLAESPRPSPGQARKTNKSQPKAAKPSDHTDTISKTADAKKNGNSNKGGKMEEKVVKQNAETTATKHANTKVPKDNSKETVNTSSTKRREKLKSEAEALDQLQETVENMVAGITVLEVFYLSLSSFIVNSMPFPIVTTG